MVLSKEAYVSAGEKKVFSVANAVDSPGNCDITARRADAEDSRLSGRQNVPMAVEVELASCERGGYATGLLAGAGCSSTNNRLSGEIDVIPPLEQPIAVRTRPGETPPTLHTEERSRRILEGATLRASGFRRKRRGRPEHQHES